MNSAGLKLLRLLQLASPALPIGAYHYSQGLESAIEAKLVVDPATLEAWLRDQLELNLGRFEAPIFLRLFDAWVARDYTQIASWNRQFLAARETSELRVETLQMAKSLIKILDTLSIMDIHAGDWLQSQSAATLPAVFSLAAYCMGLERSEALHVYLWSWLENQVAAALKTFALGQSAAQTALFALAADVTATAAAATAIADEDLTNSCPGLALLCAKHETQYSRLFRS